MGFRKSNLILSTSAVIPCQHNMFTFEILKSDESTDARLGMMTTAHGVVDTPAFMPVATQATVKSLSPQEIQDMGFEIIIVNAYHMYLRPGHRTVEKLGVSMKVEPIIGSPPIPTEVDCPMPSSESCQTAS